MKNHITNQQNKKKLVAFCHFLAGINNKFINGVKTEVGFCLMRQEHLHQQSKL